MHSVTVIGTIYRDKNYYVIQDDGFAFCWKRIGSGFIVGEDVFYVKVQGTVLDIDREDMSITLDVDSIEELEPLED